MFVSGHDRGACPEIKQPNETFLGHDLEKRAKYLKRKKPLVI
jgi:hypothetical protein